MSTQPNPMRSVGIDELKQYLDNAGIIVGSHDFDFARDNDAVKYIGYADRQHRFLVAFHDEEDDTNFFATILFVYLGSNGLICADFAGAASIESRNPQKVLEYVKRRCN